MHIIHPSTPVKAHNLKGILKKQLFYLLLKAVPFYLMEI